MDKTVMAKDGQKRPDEKKRKALTGKKRKAGSGHPESENESIGQESSAKGPKGTAVRPKGRGGGGDSCQVGFTSFVSIDLEAGAGATGQTMNRVEKKKNPKKKRGVKMNRAPLSRSGRGQGAAPSGGKRRGLRLEKKGKCQDFRGRYTEFRGGD